MTDYELDFLTIAFLLFVIVDVYVTWRFTRAARVEPRISALTGAVVCAATVTISVAIGAAIGLNSVVGAVTGTRPIPMAVTLPLLAVAVGLPSLGLLYMLALIRQWDGDARAERHLHKRDGEPGEHRHRRSTDVPLDNE